MNIQQQKLSSVLYDLRKLAVATYYLNEDFDAYSYFCSNVMPMHVGVKQGIFNKKEMLEMYKEFKPRRDAFDRDMRLTLGDDYDEAMDFTLDDTDPLDAITV